MWYSNLERQLNSVNHNAEKHRKKKVEGKQMNLKLALSVIVTCLVAITSFAQSETTSGSGGSSSVYIDPPAPDLSMLTNHAGLVSYAFKQTRGLQMESSSGAQADNYSPNIFLAITNEVKTLRNITAEVGSWSWGMSLVDPKAYVSLSGALWNTGDYNAIQNQGYPQVFRAFEAWAGGQPVRNEYGNLVLSDNDSQLHLRLASRIPIKVPGVWDARLVVTNLYGSYGFDIQTHGDWISFPSEYAGNGILVLNIVSWNADRTVGMIRTRAFNLRNNNEVPLNNVIIEPLLRDSEDFREFANTDMDVRVDSWFDYQGVEYGKVPLVIYTGDKDVSTISLSVKTSTGQFANGFTIENQATKVKFSVQLPAGVTSLKTNVPAGAYHIIPEGINLKGAGGYWYGGGKG
jgi:hypothetical protein